MKNKAIIFFVKYPQPGRVKTRLAKATGNRKAAEIYSSLVLKTLSTIRKTNICTYIFYTPASSKNKFISWIGRKYNYIPQQGRGLGSRMNNAFKIIFRKKIKKAVIVGGDIPGLTAALLKKSFKALDKADSVIGPANDGGYYLLGFNRHTCVSGAFRGIKWSTDTVFKKTVKILKRNKRKVKILSVKTDIDTMSDLYHSKKS